MKKKHDGRRKKNKEGTFKKVVKVDWQNKEIIQEKAIKEKRKRKIKKRMNKKNKEK